MGSPGGLFTVPAGLSNQRVIRLGEQRAGRYAAADGGC